MACQQINDSEGTPCNKDGSSSVRRSTDGKSGLNGAQVALSDEDVKKFLKARKSNMQYIHEELRIILIGKTGVGKSAVGNTIIGETYFKSEFGVATVTKECNKKHANIFGRNILIVDTPGIFDTETDPDILQEEIQKCIMLAAPGPHAILFVMKSTDRYKMEDYEALKIFCSYFGEKMLDHVITVFTHADAIEQENITFDAYIENSPPKLKELLEYFGNRRIAFNNKCGFVQRDQMVKYLFTMIDVLKTGKKTADYYYDKNFEIAEDEIKQRENQMEDSLKTEYVEKVNEFHRSCSAEFDKKLESVQNEYEIKISELRKNVREHETTKPRSTKWLLLNLFRNIIDVIPKPGNFIRKAKGTEKTEPEKETRCCEIDDD